MKSERPLWNFWVLHEIQKPLLAIVPVQYIPVQKNLNQMVTVIFEITKLCWYVFLHMMWQLVYYLFFF